MTRVPGGDNAHRAARAVRAGLAARPVPAWWRDAKLGIFVHWTPASVPAFAPTEHDITELLGAEGPHPLSEIPYTEWYQNSLRFPDSSVARHHAEHFPGRSYESFVPEWEAALALWDPQDWARRFAATGARYLVLVAKHHDGYCLWPTRVHNPRRPGFHCRRDVVGELAEAVRGEGMRFGVYYSGGYDWTFNQHPVGTVSDTVLAVPRGEYADYAEAQVRELIDRYRPSVLWNDVVWPSGKSRMFALFEHYYAMVPDGVVNDRWLPWSAAFDAARHATPLRRLADAAARSQSRKAKGLLPPEPPHCDVRTPEYTVFDEIQAASWECVRGIDRSFGFNRASRAEHFLGRDELLWSLADIASKNGNLLLNVGPRGSDARIDEAQAERLDWLARWMGRHAAALQDTRPWVRPGVRSVEGAEVRYTARGERVFAFVRGGPARVTLPDVTATAATQVTSIDGTVRAWSDGLTGLGVDTGGPDPQGDPLVLVLDHVSARP